MSQAGRKILVVDDDAATVELERRSLTRAGWGVVTAGTVTQGSELLRTEYPAAVLLDYSLPEGPCWPILEIAAGLTPSVPVIVVTALGDERVAAEAIHRGATDYVIKSLDFQIRLPDLVERAVRISEAEQATAHLAAIVDSSNDAIVSVSLDGTILTWNTGAAHMYNYSAPEACGQPIQMLFLHSAREQVGSLLESVHLGSVERLEVTQLRKNGEAFEAALTLSPVVTKGGGARTASVIARDITAQKEAEREIRALLEQKVTAEREVLLLNSELEQRVLDRTAQLQAANEELEAFSYSVSHDLKAPLRRVNAYCSILLDDYRSQLPEEAARCAEKASKSAAQMSCLIDDLLALSRLGRQPLEKVLVNVRDLVLETVQEQRAQQNGRLVEITVADLPPCQGDRVLLKQVFVNLMSNALKYTRPREVAKIEVGVTSLAELKLRDPDLTPEGVSDPRVPIYYVRDNGVGFDMQYRSRLFGVFQRLHSSEQFEGTGVGLATVQRIIHRHGGRVWADGIVDQGATFYFTLRARQEPPPPAQQVQGDAAALTALEQP